MLSQDIFNLRLKQEVTGIVAIIRQSGSFQYNLDMKDTKRSTCSKIFLYVMAKGIFYWSMSFSSYGNIN